MTVTNIKVNEKTLQTNIAVNNLYDTKLVDQHSLMSRGSFTTMLV